MKKFRVYGAYIATVSKEVWAEDEDDAKRVAEETFEGVDAYVNTTIGVDCEGEDIEADGEPNWDNAYVEYIDESDEVCQCPECDHYVEEVDREYDGKKIWYCDECYTYFDEDGNTYDEDELDEEDE